MNESTPRIYSKTIVTKTTCVLKGEGIDGRGDKEMALDKVGECVSHDPFLKRTPHTPTLTSCPIQTYHAQNTLHSSRGCRGQRGYS
jgi:hypothetical protein